MRQFDNETEFADYFNASLILATFATFAAENLMHYPIALMSLLGVVGLIRESRWRRNPGVRFVSILFACIWLPMAVAQFDAANFDRSLKTTLLYLHFLPAACYIVVVCAREQVLRLVTTGVAVLLLVVVFDAFAQLIWRVDLFGYPYDGNILMGLFYPKQRMGLFLGVFAPMFFHVIGTWSRRYPAVWIVLLPTIIVILMSLKRSGWAMLLIGFVVYIALRQRRSMKIFTAANGAGALVLVAVLGLVLGFHPPLQQQVQRTVGIFSADVSQIDRATSYRVTLWRTGLQIIADNPVNGVGPRGFRKVYKDYAAADDFWLARGTQGQTHPHLLIMEVAVETGMIGVLGLLLFLWLLWRHLWRQAGAGLPLWLLVAAVAWFPLNMHLAFYGSYWTSFVWMLIAIGVAESLPQRRHRDPQSATPGP